MASAAALANVALYVWGSPDPPYLQQPQQLAYINAIVSALQSAGVNPATATPSQIYNATGLVNEYWVWDPTANSGAGAAGLSDPGAVASSAPSVIPPTPAPTTPPASGGSGSTPAAGAGAATPPPSTSGSGSGSAPPATSSSSPITTPVHQDLGSYCEMFPDDPLCECFDPEGNCNYNTGTGGNSTTVVNNVTIINDGLAATDVTEAIDSALGDVWNAVVGSVDAVIAEAVAGIQNALTGIANAVKAAYNILSRLAGFILNLLQQLVNAVVQGIVKVLLDIRNLLGDLYKNVLVPIVNGMLDIRKVLLDVYQRFLRPMLIVLQDLRKFLAILAAFHVSFAQKLDAKLADLEARITRPLFYLLSFVNGVANWINLIITAGYLLQKSLFLNSLNAYIGEAINLQINAMNPAPGAAAITAAQQANAVPTAAQAVTYFSEFVTTGSGPLPTTIAQYGADFDTYLSQGL
jgi:hypothetical protein